MPKSKPKLDAENRPATYICYTCGGEVINEADEFAHTKRHIAESQELENPYHG